MASENIERMQTYLGAIAHAADLIKAQLEIIRGWQALIESEIRGINGGDDRMAADPRADSRKDSQQPPDGGFTY